MDSLSDKELQPVDALARDLKALAGTPLLVPKGVDEAVLEMAQKRMHHRRRDRFVAIAAAAAVLLAVGVVWVLSDKPSDRQGPLAEDGYGGRADVLDLLALAQKADSRMSLDVLENLSHPGVVDGKDMNVLARNIVRVSDTPDAKRAPTLHHDGQCTIDIYVDSGDQPLAAYQVEFTDPTGQIKIVGVEGGAPAAFKAPPYYDPAALGSGRIILAAYSTGRDLPAGKVRVARLRVESAEREPNYMLRLCTAGTSDGNRVPAKPFMALRGNEFNRIAPTVMGVGEGLVSDLAPVWKDEVLGRV